jgi:dienelactone hydrolase
LPQRLVEIPLEYFKKALDWLAAQSTVDRRQLAVLGASKGAELALLLASRFPEIKAVIAYVPSHVVWQGIGFGSTWTWQGQPLPFVPYKPGAGGYDPKNPTRPINLRGLYLGSLEDREAERAAAIPVERINGPVMLISGEDDQVWPSRLMADRVIARLKEHGHKHAAGHLTYASAGHGIMSYYWPTARPKTSSVYSTGGTAKADAFAQADSWPRVLQLLRESLRKTRPKQGNQLL